MCRTLKTFLRVFFMQEIGTLIFISNLYYEIEIRCSVPAQVLCHPNNFWTERARVIKWGLETA